MHSELIPASKMKDIFPGSSTAHWAQLRHKGTGPPYVKVVRKVYYRRADIEAWRDATTMTRPDQPVNA